MNYNVLSPLKQSQKHCLPRDLPNCPQYVNVPCPIEISFNLDFGVRKKEEKMSSLSVETKQKQKKEAQSMLDARVAMLEETGKNKHKDPIHRKYKAVLKQANRRLVAIEARDAHVAKVKEEKLAKKAQAKASKGKKAPPKGKKQQKQKPKKK
jgi:hypothetical protein